VAGTWSAAPRGGEQVVDVRPRRRVAEREWRAVSAAAARYGRFLQRPIVVTRNGRVVSA